MDAILQFLNESRQTTVFPVIVWVSSCVTICGAFAVGVVLASDWLLGCWMWPGAADVVAAVTIGGIVGLSAWALRKQGQR